MLLLITFFLITVFLFITLLATVQADLLNIVFLFIILLATIQANLPDYIVAFLIGFVNFIL
ncbi:hypothetical protein HMPREF0379_0112 [[Eubacterium] yurii subsp. margaretiae ATCC 43715]|jgi:hypothetical protein|nr:hypothetical protein HMPREF0379_0112 [[Eubacterium] yurii subsp. margaretiae ATCC 43715]